MLYNMDHYLPGCILSLWWLRMDAPSQCLSMLLCSNERV